MAVMNINPTRMELWNLKTKLASSRRSHKILKDKQDELMRTFLDLVKENKELRMKVESAVKKSNRHMALALSVMSKKEVETALMIPTQRVSLDIKEKKLMSAQIPEYKFELSSFDEGDSYPYGFAFTSAELDYSIKEIKDILPDMIKLSEKEKQCSILASEIERTRRRVNALEYILIPDYVDTIKYITMKLQENERSNTVRLIKVKDMMLQKTREKNG